MAIEIRAGIKKPFSAFINEAKDALRDKGTVELHGLGESIANVVRAGEILSSQGYADLVFFHTLTLSEEHDGNKRNKPKAVIRLAKAATFDKALQDFESIKKNRKQAY